MTLSFLVGLSCPGGTVGYGKQTPENGRADRDLPERGGHLIRPNRCALLDKGRDGRVAATARGRKTDCSRDRTETSHATRVRYANRRRARNSDGHWRFGTGLRSREKREEGQ